MEVFKKTSFFQMISNCQDLYGELQALLEHIYVNSEATAAYIGVVKKPIKGTREGLTEEAKDDAHIIPDAKE